MLSKAGLLLFHLFPCCSASPPLGISHKLSLPKAKFTWSALPPSRMLPCGSLNEPQNHETSELGTLESCPASLTIQLSCQPDHPRGPRAPALGPREGELGT